MTTIGGSSRSRFLARHSNWHPMLLVDPSCCGGQQHEPQASMNRENRPGCSGPLPSRPRRDRTGGAAAGPNPSRDDAGRQHEAYSPSGARQLQRALNEQLIAVDVRSAFDPIYARLANEVGNTARMKPSAGPHVRHAAVTAQHVPRGLPTTASKPGVESGFPCSSENTSGKANDQWKKRSRRQCGRVVQKALCQAIGQGSRLMQQTVA